MKLSTESYIPIKRFGIEKGLKLIKDAGFDCVDFSYYYHDKETKEKFFGENYIETAKEIRKVLNEIGLECNQAHAAFDFKIIHGDTMELSNDHYREVVRSIESAAILGAKNIVVHGIYPIDQEKESIIEVNYRYYKSLEPYLKKSNIRLAVENLFGPVYDSEAKSYTNNRFHRPEIMKEMLAKLDSEYFVACLDVGHATITGIHPQDYIRGMNKNILKVLHIHDTDYIGDRHLPPYMGKIDWNEVASALKEIEYEGEFTFEISTFFAPMENEILPDALKFVEKIGRHIIRKIEK